MKATLTFLFAILVSGTAWAGDKCPVYMTVSPLSRAAQIVKSALEKKDYMIVKDTASAIAIVTGYSAYCLHGSNSLGCEAASAQVTILDRYTGQIFNYEGNDEGIFFGASYEKALRQALRNVPRCKL